MCDALYATGLAQSSTHFVSGTYLKMSSHRTSKVNTSYLPCSRVCKGVDDPALPAKEVGNSWRTTDDINDTHHHTWIMFKRLVLDKPGVPSVFTET